MPEDRSSFDILLALLSRGLEPVVTSLVLGRLTNSDLRRCCRVSRGWRAAARAAWEREDRKRNSKNCKSRSTLLQCHRERAVCTVSDVAVYDDLLGLALASSGRLEMWSREGGGGGVRLWSAAEAHKDGIYSVDIGSLDGGRRVAVTGGDDNAVRLWCADTGERLLYLSPAHDYIVWAVRVNLGEVVSFSYDCTAAVWAVSQGDEGGSNNIKAELKRTIKGKRKR